MSSRNPHGDYVRRGGVRENKENGGLIIVFRTLLRTSESNIELYKGIHYDI